ncbi:hypothetical protein ACH79_38520 [Bradyrhizobium sp. CCBAU 051011]|uniref:MFS transporter n=1 Tax=Bradyrhizobium sp. CCBAU 051011 TaxID=858422 RepID=UPI00137463BF|nr:MFS transporter [Bradyrhizobium sp. CCBAU 051011]QHO77655.1 hypothetical protein ACH79_38520 [Bradyrhizobium sp. CCBAU 051011]
MVQLCTATALVGVAAVIAELAYLACVPTLVHQTRLVQAQSLLSSAGARIGSGPLLAGWLVSAFSAPTAILADSASFLLAAALLTLVPMRAAARSAVASTSYSAKWLRANQCVRHPILQAVTLATGTFIFWYRTFGGFPAAPDERSGFGRRDP